MEQATRPDRAETDCRPTGATLTLNMASGLSTQIDIDAQGVAWVAGANTKVTQIVLDKIAYGWSPEEIHLQHRHLSMAQVHAALAYYYEHQDRIDDEIRRDLEEVDRRASSAPASSLRAKLRDLRNQR